MKYNVIKYYQEQLAESTHNAVKIECLSLKRFLRSLGFVLEQKMAQF